MASSCSIRTPPIRTLDRGVAEAATSWTTGSGWLVQIDADENGSADLAIEVIYIDHSIVWGAGDFLL
jgi:hypothetical protein